MGSNKVISFIYRTVFPTGIIVLSVYVCIVLPYIIVHKNAEVVECLLKDNILKTFLDAWNSIDWKDKQSWAFLGVFFLWSIASEYLPGKHYLGRDCHNGHGLWYRKSGMLYNVIIY